MKAPWIRVKADGREAYSEQLTSGLWLGRQGNEHEPLFLVQTIGSQGTSFGQLRLAIAPYNLTELSRTLMFVEIDDDDLLRVTNASRSNWISIEHGAQGLGPGEQRNLALPCALHVNVNDQAQFEFQVSLDDLEGELFSLQNSPLAPMPRSTRSLLTAKRPSSFLPHAALVDAESGEVSDHFASWLQSLVAVLHGAAGSVDFEERAAEELVRLVGLSSGYVMVRTEKGDWNTVSVRHEESDDTPRAQPPSRTILDLVVSRKRTFWQVPQQIANSAASLLDVQAVVASPILDATGNAVGALYGDRRVSGADVESPEISRLEALLVEALACAVAAGWARREQERAACAAEVRFEQFFTPELSRQLVRDPDLLRGREAEVSLLFCDLRGFSRLIEKLGSSFGLKWLSDVLGLLSDCVADEAGVLIDYAGDEVFAMWGAPAPQPDHALQACRCARQMLTKLTTFNAQWQETLGGPVLCGIGINSGTTLVGNTGSHRKFKYGPVGNCVNLASRVQGATKFFQVPILLTRSTHDSLSSKLTTRRLSSVKVHNLEQPVELFDLRGDDSAIQQALCKQYEEALSMFESQRLPNAVNLLSALLEMHPGDGPALALLARAVAALTKPDEPFNSTWQLTGK